MGRTTNSSSSRTPGASSRGAGFSRPPAERLFFGVPIAEHLRACIADALGHLPPAPGSLRWTPPENWHVTLRFLGSTTPADREQIEERLSSWILPSAGNVHLRGWGTFPRAARADVLWLGVSDPSSRLATLASALELLARDVGFPAGKKPFRPHLTIARSRPSVDLRSLLAELPVLDQPMRVDGFALFRSTPGNGSPRYEQIRHFTLEDPTDEPGC